MSSCVWLFNIPTFLATYLAITVDWLRQPSAVYSTGTCPPGRSTRNHHMQSICRWQKEKNQRIRPTVQHRSLLLTTIEFGMKRTWPTERSRVIMDKHQEWTDVRRDEELGKSARSVDYFVVINWLIDLVIQGTLITCQFYYQTRCPILNYPISKPNDLL